ncbi:hypothetical protein [Pseudomonas sp. NPDC089401]|uniref:hypothetical protein n=1 Tax=Pseudomonas sp. NPDC089401 TaxID=3364462 RepID=UPI0038068FE8
MANLELVRGEKLVVYPGMLEEGGAADAIGLSILVALPYKRYCADPIRFSKL